MFKICIPPGKRPQNCWYIPVVIIRWRDFLTPPSSFLGRIVWRVRIAIAEAFGPRPHPWRPVELIAAGLDDNILEDLRRLSTIQTLVASLRPALRTPIQQALSEATAALNIKEVVDIDVAPAPGQ